MTPTTGLAPDDIRLGELSLWLRPDREGIFAQLRAERPVSFHEEGTFPGVACGPGFWALTRYVDVVRASMDAETFVSSHGGNIPDQTPDLNEIFGSMINMAAPRHTKLRKLVSAGLLPAPSSLSRTRSGCRRGGSSTRWRPRGRATSWRRWPRRALGLPR